MTKVLRPLTLGLALFLTSVPPAFAQEQPAAPAGEEEGYGPIPGYVATGFLAALAIFILCKSARR